MRGHLKAERRGEEEKDYETEERDERQEKDEKEKEQTEKNEEIMKKRKRWKRKEKNKYTNLKMGRRKARKLENARGTISC